MYNKSWVDHLDHLRAVLQVLSINQLFAGVAVDPTKINSVLKWPIPTMARGVRGFLGLAGYYRKYISGIGGIVTPLTRLLSNDGFQWTSEVIVDFSQLKKELTSLPVLRLPDFSILCDRMRCLWSRHQSYFITIRPANCIL